LAGGENQRERLTFEFGFTDRNYVPKEDAWDWVDQMSLRDKDSAYKFLAEIVRKQAIGEQVSDLTESFKLLRGEDIELAMHYNLAIGWLVKYLPRVEKEQLWQMMEDNGGLRVLELLENSVGSCRDEAEQKRILDMIQKIKERGRSATFNSE